MGFWEWAAERTYALWPGTVYFEEIVEYLRDSTFCLVGAVIIGYLLFLTLFNRFAVVRHWSDVHSLRRPWVLGALTVVILQSLASYLIGLADISAGIGDVGLTLLSFSLLEAAAGVVLFWVASLTHSPLRVKYTPPLRSLLRSIAPR